MSALAAATGVEVTSSQYAPRLLASHGKVCEKVEDIALCVGVSFTIGALSGIGLSLLDVCCIRLL